jgi:hypothetical protein
MQADNRRGPLLPASLMPPSQAAPPWPALQTPGSEFGWVFKSSGGRATWRQCLRQPHRGAANKISGPLDCRLTG